MPKVGVRFGILLLGESLRLFESIPQASFVVVVAVAVAVVVVVVVILCSVSCSDLSPRLALFNVFTSRKILKES